MGSMDVQNQYCPKHLCCYRSIDINLAGLTIIAQSELDVLALVVLFEHILKWFEHGYWHVRFQSSLLAFSIK